MKYVISSAATTLGWVAMAPTMLLLALNMPWLCYRTKTSRFISLLLVSYAAGRTIFVLDIENASLAFMTGILEGWTVIWAAVLLLRYDPCADACRRRWCKSPVDDGSFEHGNMVWQEYPQRNFKTRIAWTLDLLVSFRGVGWCMGQYLLPVSTRIKSSVRNLLIWPCIDKHNRGCKPDLYTPKIDIKDGGWLAAVLSLVYDIFILKAILIFTERVGKQIVGPDWQLHELQKPHRVATRVSIKNLRTSIWSTVNTIEQNTEPFLDFDPQKIQALGSLKEMVKQGLAGKRKS